MTTSRTLMVFLYLLITMVAAPASQGQLFGQNDDFLSPEQAFQYRLFSSTDGSVVLSWDIEPGYYLYRERIEITGVDGEIANIEYPLGNIISDEYFGDSEVYFNNVDLIIGPADATQLNLTWQGCSEAGLCYPPQHATVDLNGKPVTDSLPLTVTKTEKQQLSSVSANADMAQDQSLAYQLADSGLLWNLTIFFGLGLLLVFTPCVLPMMPILSAVIVGSEAKRGKAFSLSLVFVTTMAITYALLGIAAALAGANLQAVLQTPLFIGSLSIVFVLLALAMFGLYELQLPTFVRDRLEQLNRRQHGGSVAGAAIMGVFAALLASPCMTAPLAGALIYIADSGDAAFGGLALFALGLGMGAPLVLLATLGSSLLPKPGAWMNGIKAIFGFIMLGTAIWFLERVIPGSVTLTLWGALLIGAGVTLWKQAQFLTQTGAIHYLVATTGLLACLWGGLMMVGAAAGGDEGLQPLKPFGASGRVMQAVEAIDHTKFNRFKSVANLNAALDIATDKDQWTLVDFYADWCISCKVIEDKVFGDTSVKRAMSGMQLLRADVTDNDTIDQALMQHLQVLGPPSILLFGPDGKEYRAHRTVGEISADAFLQRIRSAQSTSISEES